MIRRFSIFYNDGTVIHGGGKDEELVPVYFPKSWLEAPSDGVCQINVENEKGTVINNQTDHYFMFPHESHGEGSIFGANDVGAYLRQTGLVKFGGWTSRKNFQEIKAKARKDTWTPQTNEQLQKKVD